VMTVGKFFSLGRMAASTVSRGHNCGDYDAFMSERVRLFLVSLVAFVAANTLVRPV
jgi:hypothetical protein